VAETRIENGALQNTSSGYTVGTKWLQEKARTATWQTLFRLDLKDIDATWDKVEELATDRAEWRQRVAQRMRLGAGSTKVLSWGATTHSPLVSVLLFHLLCRGLLIGLIIRNINQSSFFVCVQCNTVTILPMRAVVEAIYYRPTLE